MFIFGIPAATQRRMQDPMDWMTLRKIRLAWGYAMLEAYVDCKGTDYVFGTGFNR